MSRVRIYTKQHCVFSEKALLFLQDVGIPYQEVDITDDEASRAAMTEAAGGDSSTPQVFIDGEHIGGYEDLVEEDHQGRLAARLASGVDQPGAP
jgi:glutaredoxin 3